MKGKRAIVSLKGADCPSCVYTIEHTGRKVEGVLDIAVSAIDHRVYVTYEGNPGSLERIAEIVRHIGYDAEIQWDSISSAEEK
jgi:cation transport ATPase